MKCFVHVGNDPLPKETDDAEEAVELAEAHLFAANDPTHPLSIKWRRDELYPDNFSEYTLSELLSELEEKGKVVLQLVEIVGDGLPTLGEIANIFTSAQEEENNMQAQQALDDLARSLAKSYNCDVTLTDGKTGTTYHPSGAQAAAKIAAAKPKKKVIKATKKAMKKATPKKAVKKNWKKKAVKKILAKVKKVKSPKLLKAAKKKAVKIKKK